MILVNGLNNPLSIEYLVPIATPIMMISIPTLLIKFSPINFSRLDFPVFCFATFFVGGAGLLVTFEVSFLTGEVSTTLSERKFFFCGVETTCFVASETVDDSFPDRNSSSSDLRAFISSVYSLCLLIKELSLTERSFIRSSLYFIGSAFMYLSH